MNLLSVVFVLCFVLTSSVPLGDELNVGRKVQQSADVRTSNGQSYASGYARVSGGSNYFTRASATTTTTSGSPGSSPVVESVTRTSTSCSLPRVYRATYRRRRLNVFTAVSQSACCQACWSWPNGGCRSWWRSSRSRRCYLSSRA